MTKTRLHSDATLCTLCSAADADTNGYQGNSGVRRWSRDLPTMEMSLCRSPRSTAKTQHYAAGQIQTFGAVARTHLPERAPDSRENAKSAWQNRKKTIVHCSAFSNNFFLKAFHLVLPRDICMRRPIVTMHTDIEVCLVFGRLLGRASGTMCRLFSAFLSVCQ